MRGEFVPIEREEYVDRVVTFLQHLDPCIAVHRLAALASRHDELVAPSWVALKMETYQVFLDELARKKAYQGQHFRSEVTTHL